MSPNGIAEIGRTDQMIAIAEVPEDSIAQSASRSKSHNQQ